MPGRVPRGAFADNDLNEGRAHPNIDSRAGRPGCEQIAFCYTSSPNSPKGKQLTMNIVERLVGDVTIIDLQGKIMIGEGDEALRDAVNKAIDSGKNKLVLNLAEVPYVDSAGLGELVRCYSTVNKKGGKLKLLNLTKKIQDLLAITKLLTVFETFDSEDEAIKSFA